MNSGLLSILFRNISFRFTNKFMVQTSLKNGKVSVTYFLPYLFFIELCLKYFEVLWNLFVLLCNIWIQQRYLVQDFYFQQPKGACRFTDVWVALMDLWEISGNWFLQLTGKLAFVPGKTCNFCLKTWNSPGIMSPNFAGHPQ